MIDTNNIKCTLEDAWKEFERTGEITNSSENMIHAVEELLKENEYLQYKLDKEYYVVFTGPYSQIKVLHKDITEVKFTDFNLRSSSAHKVVIHHGDYKSVFISNKEMGDIFHKWFSDVHGNINIQGTSLRKCEYDD